MSIGFLLANRRPSKNKDCFWKTVPLQFCSWRFLFDVCGVLQTKLGGGVKGFIFSPLPGEMIQFD